MMKRLHSPSIILSLGLVLHLGAGVGCGDPGDAELLQEITADAAVDRSQVEACGPAPIFAPGEISLPDRQEFRLSFAPDGKTAYYHVDTIEPPYQTIYETRIRHGHWTSGVAVAFSGEFQDSDPFVAPDGETMFFSSARPINGIEQDNINLWMSKRKPGPSGQVSWGKPIYLGDRINTPNEELYPSVSDDGTLYWASGKFADDGDFNIYRSVRGRHGYGAPELLSPAINSAEYWEFNPWISPNGKLLFFASANRPDGKGQADIYVSLNFFGHWLPAVNLGPTVNTAGPEFHPTFMPRQQKLYFVRLTGDDFASDFYSADAACLLE